MFELAGQKYCNENLLNGPLDSDYGDHTKDGMGSIPEFQEPLIISSLSERMGINYHGALTKNSKNPMMPTSDRKWASAAMYDPNFGHPEKTGPRSSEVKKRVRSTVAFQTIGPRATRDIRMRGLGGWIPSLSGKDLTNM